MAWHVFLSPLSHHYAYFLIAVSMPNMESILTNKGHTAAHEEFLVKFSGRIKADVFRKQNSVFEIQTHSVIKQNVLAQVTNEQKIMEGHRTRWI